jgi:hypothetical protein
MIQTTKRLIEVVYFKYSPPFFYCKKFKITQKSAPHHNSKNCDKMSDFLNDEQCNNNKTVQYGKFLK